MHLRVTLLIFVLGRTRRVNDRRIDDRPTADRHARTSQLRIDGPEDALPKTVLFQEVTELTDRGLVRNPLAAKIDADESPHRVAIVERLFDARIAQIEPVLEEIHTQHSLNTDWRTSGSFANGIVPLNDLAQALPRDHSVHLVEKLRPSRRLGKAFKTGGRKRDLLVRHEQIVSETAGEEIRAFLG
jgi:hypothetical protein